MAGEKDYDVVVMGGGIAGLVAAYECMRAGKTVFLLEKERHLGGRVQIAALAGVAVDAGAESFAVRADSVVVLARELGIEDLLIAPSSNRSWLHSYDEDYSYPAVAPGILGIPDMTAAHWEAFAEVLGQEGYLQAAQDLTAPWDISAETLAAMSLAELIEQRLGRAVMKRFVAPTVKAVYAVDPYQISVDALVPGFSQAVAEQHSVSKAAAVLKNRLNNTILQQSSVSAVMSFNKGMVTLVNALADALKNSSLVDILLESVAEEQCDNQQVTYTSDSNAVRTTVRSKAVVNACTDHGAPQNRRITIVAAALRTEALDDSPRGTGVITYGTDPAVKAKAATHVTAKWGSNTALDQLRAVGVHVIRFSFDSNVWKKINRGHDAVDIITDSTGTLFGIHGLGSSDVVDWTAVTHGGTGVKNTAVYQRRKEAQAKHRPVTWVGCGISGASITNIVTDTRQEVKRLLETLS